ncbi:MAG: Ribose ABC transport system, permease protein RbsC, partial [uncultured Gemmatimonadetes bacterium]
GNSGADGRGAGGAAPAARHAAGCRKRRSRAAHAGAAGQGGFDAAAAGRRGRADRGVRVRRHPLRALRHAREPPQRAAPEQHAGDGGAGDDAGGPHGRDRPVSGIGARHRGDRGGDALGPGDARGGVGRARGRPAAGDHQRPPHHPRPDPAVHRHARHDDRRARCGARRHGRELGAGGSHGRGLPLAGPGAHVRRPGPRDPRRPGVPHRLHRPALHPLRPLHLRRRRPPGRRAPAGPQGGPRADRHLRPQRPPRSPGRDRPGRAPGRGPAGGRHGLGARRHRRGGRRRDAAQRRAGRGRLHGCGRAAPRRDLQPVQPGGHHHPLVAGRAARRLPAGRGGGAEPPAEARRPWV